MLWEAQGVSCSNLLISDKANLINAVASGLGWFAGKERDEGKIGTTLRGIGPVFSDKAADSA